MSDSVYPKRDAFFAHRFTRLMQKCCLGNELGPETCWLLTCIVHTEDSKRYRGPVTFFNHALFSMVGFSNEKSFINARTKAIKAGWLHYEPGKKRQAGKYWVKIPSHYLDLEDNSTDESGNWFTVENDSETAGKVQGNNTENISGVKNDRESAGKPTGKVQGNSRESDSPSSLSPSPSLSPSLKYSSNNNNNEQLSFDLNSDLSNLELEKYTFELFFTIYPNKEREREALVQWRAKFITGELAKEVILKAQLFAKSPKWQQDSGYFVPQASNWLKEERWKETPVMRFIPTGNGSTNGHQKETLSEKFQRVQKERKDKQLGDQL